MPLAPGSKFGPYEIISSIGAGGMGEVYRARDTRLGRDVALKVLPESVLRDSDRLRCFEQEARAVALRVGEDDGFQPAQPALVELHQQPGVQPLLGGDPLTQLIVVDRPT